MKAVCSLLPLALGALFVADAADATTVTTSGTPFCQYLHPELECGLAFEAVIDTALSSDPVVLIVEIEDMRHIQIFSRDELGGVLEFELGLQPPPNESVQIGFELKFLDMNGDDVTPPELVAHVSGGSRRTVSLSPTEGVIVGIGFSFIADLIDGLVFHGISLELAGPPDVTWIDARRVTIRSIDETSNVGIWTVPEPERWLCLGLGLAVWTCAWVRRQGRAPAA